MSEKYTILKFIATGTGGRVFLVKNALNEVLARKSIELQYQRKDQYKRLYREICILKHLKSRYCICLFDLYGTIDDENQLQEVSLLLPFMQYDLRSMIKDYKLIYQQIIKIIYQLLLGLKYLFDCGIFHRDLKPSNIGINENLDLKILDFGLARDMNEDLTEYVVTRWYRPLEVYCTSQYTIAVDMWSAGCIFAELFTGQVLFKGSDQIDQAKRILAIMGWPSDEILNKMDNQNVVLGLGLFKPMAATSNELENYIRKPIETVVHSDEDVDNQCTIDVFNLISRMLDLDPDKRITPAEAIKSSLFIRHKSFVDCYLEDGTAQTFTCNSFLENGNGDFWIDAIKYEIGNFTS